MAIHYMNVTHQKCQYSDGRRRSPLIGPSYDSDLPLKDNVTNRTIYRPHTDGTVVWHSEIESEDADCPYIDDRIPLQSRMEKLYNDAGKLLKKNDQQFRACIVIALPNSLTKKQAIRCAKKIAKSLSKRLHRIVEYSIHYKDGNLHVHIGIPHWEWDKSKHTWGAKAKSFYIDKNNQPILGHYIDENGNDLRVPLLEKNENDEYVQKRDKKGGRIWKRRKINFLNKNELSWLHNEIDLHINAELERVGSEERITRPNKIVRDKLKNAGLTTQHIGPQSCRTKDQRFYEITEHNAKVKKFENALITTMNHKKEAEQLINALEEESIITSASLEKTEARSKALNKSLIHMENDTSIADYVNKELKPTKLFVNDAVNKYNEFLSQKQKVLQPLINSLETAIPLATDIIYEKSKKLKPTTKNNARIRLWNNNIKMIKKLAHSLKNYSNHSFIKSVQEIARKRWKGFNSWSRLNYVKKHCEPADALIYQAFLNLNDNDPNRTDDIPQPLVVPNTKYWQQHATIESIIWKNIPYENDFTPPIDTELLSEIVASESALTETSVKDNMKIFADYKPNEPKQLYQDELASIAENERKTDDAVKHQASAETKSIPIAKKQKQNADTATHQVSAFQEKSVPAKPTPPVKVLSEDELELAIKRYNELADSRDAEKTKRMKELILKRYEEEFVVLTQARASYVFAHKHDADYKEPLEITRENFLAEQTKYYTSLPVKFRSDCIKHNIDLSHYQTLANEAQIIKKSIDTSYDAHKKPKKPLRRRKLQTKEKTTTLDK